jgi:hypothetical protein
LTGCFSISLYAGCSLGLLCAFVCLHSLLPHALGCYIDIAMRTAISYQRSTERKQPLDAAAQIDCGLIFAVYKPILHSHSQLHILS